jgi:hypothetical protein
MNWSDWLGWMAAGSTLAAFCCQEMNRLRAFAIMANVCFIGFGVLQAVWPVLALHAILLPLNLVRWHQATQRARDDAREAAYPATIPRCSDDAWGEGRSPSSRASASFSRS